MAPSPAAAVVFLVRTELLFAVPTKGHRASACILSSLLLVILYESMPVSSCNSRHRSDLNPPCLHPQPAGKQTSPITATLMLTAVGPAAAATIPGSQTSTPTHPSLCTHPSQQKPRWRLHWAQTLQPMQLAVCHVLP